MSFFLPIILKNNRIYSLFSRRFLILLKVCYNKIIEKGGFLEHGNIWQV